MTQALLVNVQLNNQQVLNKKIYSNCHENTRSIEYIYLAKGMLVISF